MKITIYELLGMIKDGKAPKKIKDINSIWEYDKETKDYFHNDLWLIYSMNSIGLTEREVEILEESKEIPKKLDWNKNDFTYPEGNLMSEETADMLMEMQDKINEILDYLESKGE